MSQSASSQVYSNIQGLQAINALARDDKNAALGEVAQQFESILLKSMLKSMRDANKVFAEGNYLSSDQVEFYQQMFDDQLSLDMSKRGGLGLGEQLQRQLHGRYGDNRADRAVSDVEKMTVDAKLGNAGAVSVPLQQGSFSVVDLGIVPARKAPLANSVAGHGSAGYALGPDVASQYPLNGADVVVEPAVRSSPAVSSPSARSLDGSSAGFVTSLRDIAVTAANKIGVSPDVLLAQSALETGWGRHVPSDARGSSHNLFGIKADARWQGDSVKISTLEYRDGQPIRVVAAFRRYDSYADSFADYARFITEQPRYQRAVEHAHDAQRYSEELQRAGYATDPQYAQKIASILSSSDIRRSVVASSESVVSDSVDAESVPNKHHQG